MLNAKERAASHLASLSFSGFLPHSSENLFSLPWRCPPHRHSPSPSYASLLPPGIHPQPFSFPNVYILPGQLSPRVNSIFLLFPDLSLHQNLSLNTELLFYSSLERGVHYLLQVDSPEALHAHPIQNRMNLPPPRLLPHLLKSPSLWTPQARNPRSRLNSSFSLSNDPKTHLQALTVLPPKSLSDKIPTLSYFS